MLSVRTRRIAYLLVGVDGGTVTVPLGGASKLCRLIITANGKPGKYLPVFLYFDQGESPGFRFQHAATNAESSNAAFVTDELGQTSTFRIVSARDIHDASMVVVYARVEDRDLVGIPVFTNTKVEVSLVEDDVTKPERIYQEPREQAPAPDQPEVASEVADFWKDAPPAPERRFPWLLFTLLVLTATCGLGYLQVDEERERSRLEDKLAEVIGPWIEAGVAKLDEALEPPRTTASTPRAVPTPPTTEPAPSPPPPTADAPGTLVVNFAQTTTIERSQLALPPPPPLPPPRFPSAPLRRPTAYRPGRRPSP